MKRALVGLALAAALPASAQGEKAAPLVERGRYLVTIAGCNDCHTPNFAPSGGKVPEAQWLTGDALGWRGPWGTTDAPNLRLYMPALMTNIDLRAIYRYVRHLGAAGEPAPEYVPPENTPPLAYMELRP